MDEPHQSTRHHPIVFMTIIGTGCFGNCFTIRNLRLLKLDLQFSFVLQTPFQGTEWNSPCPWTNSLFQFFRLFYFPGGIFLRIRFNITIIFSTSASFTAAIAREYLALGYLMKLNGFSQSCRSRYFQSLHLSISLYNQYLRLPVPAPEIRLAPGTNKKLCHTFFRTTIGICQIITFVYLSAHHFEILQHITDMGFNGSLEEIKK